MGVMKNQAVRRMLGGRGIGRGGGMHVAFSMFVDRKEVYDRIDRKKLKVLARTGGYARTTMQRSIRAPKKMQRLRSVRLGSREFFVPHHTSRVLDKRTGRQASKDEANRVREIFAQRRQKDGVGKPPRRGPTDNLRKYIFFGVEPAEETVVIGPLMFTNQPRLVGAVSVPELLDKGGHEWIGNQLVRYDPRPYTSPVQPVAEKKLAELIERTPL